MKKKYKALVKVTLLLTTSAFEAENYAEAESRWPKVKLDVSDLHEQLEVADMELEDLEEVDTSALHTPW